MSDFVLERGQNIIIDSDTTVDDFYYRGGTIRIKPQTSFVLGGDYYFSPTSSDDPIGTIFDGIISRIALDCGRNGVFSGFFVYDQLPENKPLFFPCIVVDKDSVTDKTTELFNDEYLESLKLAVDIAFKRDKILQTQEDTLKEKALAEYYQWAMRKIFDDIKYKSDYINISDFRSEATIVEPSDPKHSLYGVALDLSIEFKKSDI